MNKWFIHTAFLRVYWQDTFFAHRRLAKLYGTPFATVCLARRFGRGVCLGPLVIYVGRVPS